jgi:hypothetical protein
VRFDDGIPDADLPVAAERDAAAFADAQDRRSMKSHGFSKSVNSEQ